MINIETDTFLINYQSDVSTIYATNKTTGEVWFLQGDEANDFFDQIGNSDDTILEKYLLTTLQQG